MIPKAPFEEWLRGVRHYALRALFSVDYLLERLALTGGTAIDLTLEGRAEPLFG